VLTLTHPLDYLRWLLGEVSALWAFVSHRGLDLLVEDTVEIGLRFGCGALGSLHLDYVQRPPRHTLEIIGALGTLMWDNINGAVGLSQAAKDGSPGPWQEFAPPPGFERNDMFLAQTRHFIEILRGQAEPRCSLEDGIQALRLALAVRDSAQLGKIVRL
jgi:predicted dehydrogenase